MYNCKIAMSTMIPAAGNHTHLEDEVDQERHDEDNK